MSKRLDVIIAYSSIVLVLLTPIYYAVNLLAHLISITSNDVWSLILAATLDSVVVFHVFKIYYK